MTNIQFKSDNNQHACIFVQKVRQKGFLITDIAGYAGVKHFCQRYKIILNFAHQVMINKFTLFFYGKKTHLLPLFNYRSILNIEGIL